MKKIVIAGHASSGLQEVEALLLRCGMVRPRPSRRDGMLPAEITATLCKAHACAPLDDVVEEEQLRAVETSPIWQGMALDLMLGNIDAPLWGWADPLNIYLLDYWLALDKHITFVLVYDHPERCLVEYAASTAMAAEAVERSAADVERLLAGWRAYNGALLAFYLRHPDRCLLVNAPQVAGAVDSYLEQLQGKLSAPLTHPAGLPATALASPTLANGPTDASPHGEAKVAGGPRVMDALPALVSGAMQQAAMAPERVDPWFRDGGLPARFLAQQLLDDHPAVVQMYEELQAAASLPQEVLSRASRARAAAAWLDLVNHRSATVELVSRLHQRFLAQRDDAEARGRDAARQLQDLRSHSQVEQSRLLQQLTDGQRAHQQLQQDIDAARDERDQLQAQIRQARGDQSRLQAQVDAGEGELARLRSEIRASEVALSGLRQQHVRIEEENDLLLQQLHESQDEVERRLQREENQKLQVEQERQQMAAQLRQAHAALEASRQLERQLRDQISSTLAVLGKAQDSGREAESRLLARQALLESELASSRKDYQQAEHRGQAQVAELQAGLAATQSAARAAENQHLARIATLETSLDEQAAAHRAAEQQLLTRCQDLESSLAQVREAAQVAERDRQAQSQAAALAAADQLQRADAEIHRLREREQTLASALEERSRPDPALEATALENRQLIAQLHRALEELERYHHDNERLRATAAQARRKPPAPYGAADRVRQQLSYRLGARVIHQSRSLGGWLGMPAAILREVRQYRLDAQAKPAGKLPPIQNYADAYEAERLKKHLSYRVGQAMVSNARSPLGWLRMPFAIRREIKSFRRERSAA
ncbi:MAG: hypothetical protein RL722_537 [Pseudomonadota bacterium]|jgi:hypothetical protein